VDGDSKLALEHILVRETPRIFVDEQLVGCKRPLESVAVLEVAAVLIEGQRRLGGGGPFLDESPELAIRRLVFSKTLQGSCMLKLLVGRIFRGTQKQAQGDVPDRGLRGLRRQRGRRLRRDGR